MSDLKTADSVMQGDHLDTCSYLLSHCGNLQADETVAIVFDASCREVGHLMVRAARSISANVVDVEIGDQKMHGSEPPEAVALAFAKADLLIGVTGYSLAHSKARKAGTDRGGRYLSLADYSLELLSHPALQTNFRDQKERVSKIADAMTSGDFAIVETELGTSIELDLRGRTGNAAPGYVMDPGSLGSPPDIEANIAPVESASRGLVVVDGSIPYPGLGLLDDPVTLEVIDGNISGIEGPPATVDKLNRLFEDQGNGQAKVIAECGVGLNPNAYLNGMMLMDEGALGTIHFGFGSNATIGGANDVSFHLDMVIRKAKLTIDGKCIIDNGEMFI